MTDKTATPLESLMHVSIAPHVRRAESVQTIMISVIIALVPAFAGSLYYFGLRSLFLICASILGTVGAEWLINAALKKPRTIKDASALITGVLLAFTLPPTLRLGWRRSGVCLPSSWLKRPSADSAIISSIPRSPAEPF